MGTQIRTAFHCWLVLGQGRVQIRSLSVRQQDKFPFPTLMLCPNDSNELNLVREFYNLHPEVGIDSLAQYNRLTVRKYLETAISGRRQALSDSNLPIEDGEVTKCLERNVTNVLEEGDCGVVKLLVALIDLQGNVFRATIVVKLYSEAVFLVSPHIRCAPGEQEQSLLCQVCHQSLSKRRCSLPGGRSCFQPRISLLCVPTTWGL